MSTPGPDLQELLAASHRLRTATTQLKGIARRNRMNVSNARWEGVARLRFEDQSHSWESDLEACAISLDRIAGLLEAAARRAEQSGRAL